MILVHADFPLLMEEVMPLVKRDVRLILLGTIQHNRLTAPSISSPAMTR